MGRGRRGHPSAQRQGIAKVVARFDALLRFTSLKLGRQLGTEVVPVLSRREAADRATSPR
jgi:hypothetical protein